MAPIKLEEQLKDKLEKRSLQPSIDSWSKLSDRLDAEEKKSKNPWFWWMGIAAGLIVFLAIAIQIFGAKSIEDTKPKFVNEETKEQSIENQQPNTIDSNTIELAVEDEPVEVETESKAPIQQPEIINYKTVTNKSSITKSQLANSDDNKKKEVETKNEVNQHVELVNKEAVINTAALTEAIKDFKSENTSVTDREVDSLLKLASKELFKDKLKKNTTNTVNAEDLLLEVEEGMGQSFRSKVYEALKTSYETVKTAVAERNN